MHMKLAQTSNYQVILMVANFGHSFTRYEWRIPTPQDYMTITERGSTLIEVLGIGGPL